MPVTATLCADALPSPAAGRRRPIRVLVCDDDGAAREGIRQVLDHIEGIVLGAQADHGQEAVRLLRAATPAEPIHVVLMDIGLPHRDGLDVLRRLRAEFPDVAVLMLSRHPDKQYAVRSLKLGACGCLSHGADAVQMAEAIRKVVSGGLYLPPLPAAPTAVAPRGAAPPPPPPTLHAGSAATTVS